MAALTFKKIGTLNIKKLLQHNVLQLKYSQESRPMTFMEDTLHLTK